MERFTTDNPQDNVSTARNLFYIKDQETWVRGGGPEPEYADVPLYDLVRRIIQTHGLAIDTSNNDIMGDCLYERLFDCVDTVEGVVALLYTAAWAFAELRNRLAAYEDTGLTPDDLPCAAELFKAEKEGRCVVLPSKDYTFTIRGDLAISIIKANCNAAARAEAEGPLGGGQK